MKDSHETVCFTCGQPAGEVPRLNCLPGGQVCPTCRDRLLECLPPCLPGQGPALEQYFEEESESRESETTNEAPRPGPQLSPARGPGQLLRGADFGDEPA